MTRRALAWLLIAAGTLAPVLPRPPLESGAYVQCVGTRSAHVCKIDAAPRRLQLVVRAPDGREVWRQGEAEARRRHDFLVEGLEPGRRHPFELLDADGGPVDAGSLKTAPEGPGAEVRFCVIADSGDVPWWGWCDGVPLLRLLGARHWLPCSSVVAAIGRQAARLEPDLWLHAGDIVYPYGEHRHYGPAFFRPFGDLLRHAPCYAVLGNHDFEKDGGRPALQNLVLPKNAVSGDERMWSFGFGPARFVGIDLLQAVDAGHPALRLLRAELGQATEPWRVVVGHYPPFSASRQQDRKDLVEHLWPLLRELKVDLYFCGNDHNYQRFGADGEPQIVVTGGGGKSVYEIGTHPRLRASHSGFQFCSVVIGKGSAKVRVLGPDGGTIDEFELRK